MITQIVFIDELNSHYHTAKRQMCIESHVRASICVPAEAIDFDIEAIMMKWCEETEVNLAVVDIASVTEKDVAALPEILKEPTIFLLKNFGDHSKDDLRRHYRQLVKDSILISKHGICAETNNFVFAVAVVTKDNPINDASEMDCLALISEC